MLDRAKEEEDLAKAEVDIAAARDRIARLELAIEAVAEQGEDTAIGDRILHSMRETLSAFIEHRNTIQRTIEAIDKGLL